MQQEGVPSQKSCCQSDPNEETEHCLICLMPLEQTLIASLPCQHDRFHFDCISKWSKVSAICPYCKQNFSTIFFDNQYWKVQEFAIDSNDEPAFEDISGGGSESENEEQEALCAICDDACVEGDSSARFTSCRCGVSVHHFCIGWPSDCRQQWTCVECSWRGQRGRNRRPTARGSALASIISSASAHQRRYSAAARSAGANTDVDEGRLIPSSAGRVNFYASGSSRESHINRSNLSGALDMQQRALDKAATLRTIHMRSDTLSSRSSSNSSSYSIDEHVRRAQSAAEKFSLPNEKGPPSLNKVEYPTWDTKTKSFSPAAVQPAQAPCKSVETSTSSLEELSWLALQAAQLRLHQNHGIKLVGTNSVVEPGVDKVTVNDTRRGGCKRKTNSTSRAFSSPLIREAAAAEHAIKRARDSSCAGNSTTSTAAYGSSGVARSVGIPSCTSMNSKTGYKSAFRSRSVCGSVDVKPVMSVTALMDHVSAIRQNNSDQKKTAGSLTVFDQTINNTNGGSNSGCGNDSNSCNVVDTVPPPESRASALVNQLLLAVLSGEKAMSSMIPSLTALTMSADPLLVKELLLNAYDVNAERHQLRQRSDSRIRLYTRHSFLSLMSSFLQPLPQKEGKVMSSSSSSSSCIITTSTSRTALKSSDNEDDQQNTYFLPIRIREAVLRVLHSLPIPHYLRITHTTVISGTSVLNSLTSQEHKTTVANRGLSPPLRSDSEVSSPRCVQGAQELYDTLTFCVALNERYPHTNVGHGNIPAVALRILTEWRHAMKSRRPLGDVQNIN